MITVSSCANGAGFSSRSDSFACFIARRATSAIRSLPPVAVSCFAPSAIAIQSAVELRFLSGGAGIASSAKEATEGACDGASEGTALDVVCTAADEAAFAGAGLC